MKANWYSNKKLRKGFSLVELIFVMIIIGILSAMIYMNNGDVTDDAKYTTEINNIESFTKGITTMNAKSKIYDILATGVGQEISDKIPKKMNDLTYFIASKVDGNKSAQSLVAFGIDDASKSKIKTFATSLENEFDKTPSGTDGKFQYDTTCSTATTDGSDCYYMVYLDGKILQSEAWEPKIGGADLNATSTTSVASDAQTFVKLN